MPETVEEVQDVVRIAGRHGVPLWTHSTGRNNGYGGAAPRVKGSVIVSLRNMNQVLEINEELAYAVVEPGVRWFDLYEAIRAGGHRLMLSIADWGWGSVIGNTLDNGVTYPEVYMPLWLKVWRDDDLAPLMDTLSALMLDGTIRMVPQVMNTLLLGSVLSSRDQWYQGEGAMPDEAIDRMAGELDIGRWCMRFTLYGDEAVVDHRFQKIRTAFEQIEGAEVTGAKHAPEEIPNLEHPAERIQGGVPNLDWNNMTGWYGGEHGGHIGFSPIAPSTGAGAMALRDLLRGSIEHAGLDYIVGILPISARSFTHITMVIFDAEDEAQTRSAYEVCRRLVTEAAKLGYGEYRAHLDFMDLASEQYSFNHHAYRRFCETIKDAVDPQGILSPGKQGIWPQAMRSARDEA